MLSIRNLVVSYGHVEALKGVDIEVPEGSIVSVIGSNGAGKTTLLAAISGLVRPESGSITLDGKPLPGEPHAVVAKGIVQVPEGRRIFAGLTVRENLVMGAFTDRNPRRFRTTLETMYTRFPRLREREAQQAGTLSGGEQQMLAVCRGLMSHPRFILLDEPSLGLAPLLVTDVFRLIREVRDMGVTVLVVEQNAQRALSIADRAFVLENGLVVKKGTGAQLLSDDSIRRAYLGSREWCRDV